MRLFRKENPGWLSQQATRESPNTLWMRGVSNTQALRELEAIVTRWPYEGLWFHRLHGFWLFWWELYNRAAPNLWRIQSSVALFADVWLGDKADDEFRDLESWALAQNHFTNPRGMAGVKDFGRFGLLTPWKQTWQWKINPWIESMYFLLQIVFFTPRLALVFAGCRWYCWILSMLMQQLMILSIRLDGFLFWQHWAIRSDGQLDLECYKRSSSLCPKSTHCQVDKTYYIAYLFTGTHHCTVSPDIHHCFTVTPFLNSPSITLKRHWLKSNFPIKKNTPKN